MLKYCLHLQSGGLYSTMLKYLIRESTGMFCSPNSHLSLSQGIEETSLIPGCLEHLPHIWTIGKAAAQICMLQVIGFTTLQCIIMLFVICHQYSIIYLNSNHWQCCFPREMVYSFVGLHDRFCFRRNTISLYK